jgi:hypothetical protein
VTRYRSRKHGIRIRDNGAIQIIDHTFGNVVFDKSGADEQTI